MTKNIAVVFPGQGSQSVGMVQELYDNFQCVRTTYEEASDALGFDVWELTSTGPTELLNQTVNTQPAMLVAGVACWRAFQERSGIQPRYFAGHSLGEYSALVASGQISFSAAVKLARKRAQEMQEAVPQGVGAMAAVLGLDAEIITNVCAKISAGDPQRCAVWAANDNAPGQIVIAGHKLAVEQACTALKESGAKRALVLPVSVPSHCPLMQPAADIMRAEFERIQWQPAHTPVVHNSDVAIHTNSDEVITSLSEQLVMPVRWVETVRYFADQEIDTILEVGPGKVLAGLTKRIDKTITALPVFDMASLDAAVS